MSKSSPPAPRNQVPDDLRCQAYTDRGGRCSRYGTCVTFQPYSRYCVQHARVYAPGRGLW